MKKKIVILILIFTGIILNAITIPYSQTELKTETNHLSDFVRVAPDDSLAIPLQTDVWLWHDKENLYVLCEAEIDENFEKGKLASTDEWAECDFFRIQIITDVKNYYAYMFYSNPLGNKYDSIRKSDMDQETSWNSNYKYESIISDNLWISSMKIPLKDLRFYGNPPYKWKIILTRYFQKEDEYYSIPYGLTNMGKDYFRTAFDITINEELSKNKNYRITPYFIKKYDLIEETDSFDPNNIGLDFSYNPSSATRVKVSFNPDFSDIPMDSAEDNFNVQYAPHFEENRYFFIEDLDVFGVESNLFYSRHIMQPQYAVKLSGNSENFSYGFLSAMDKEVVEDGEIVNSDDFYNMLAFKPKLGNLSIQMTLLNRMNKDYHNEVLMINPIWEFMKNQSVWSEIDASYKVDEDIERGYQVSVGYNGKKGDLNWSTSVYNCSKNYKADMGRVFETDFTALNANVWQNSELNGKNVKNYGSNFWLHKAFMNDNRELLEQNGGFNFWLNTQNKMNVSINFNIGQENYSGSVFSWNNINLSFGFWGNSKFNLNFSYDIGHSLVYNLNEVYSKEFFFVGFSGNFCSHIAYYISTQRMHYYDFPTDCGIDNEYWLGNTDLTINFSNNLSNS